MTEDSGTAHICPLKLAGNKTIAEAEEIHSALSDLISSAPSPEVDCSDVVETDLSFVQLLLAARRSAESRGKILKLTTAAPKPLLEVLERAGFVTPEGSPRSADQAFWTGTNATSMTITKVLG